MYVGIIWKYLFCVNFVYLIDYCTGAVAILVSKKDLQLLLVSCPSYTALQYSISFG